MTARRPPTLYTYRCAWCETEHRTRTESSSYCSTRCARRHAAVNYARNKRQEQEMLARPPGPKGCATVEEWLAAGGVIWRQELVPALAGATPVRPKAGDWSGGRVRR